MDVKELLSTHTHLWYKQTDHVRLTIWEATTKCPPRWRRYWNRVCEN